MKNNYSFNWKQFVKAMCMIVCAAIIIWFVFSWAEVAFHNVFSNTHEYSALNLFKILIEARKG